MSMLEFSFWKSCTDFEEEWEQIYLLSLIREQSENLQV